MKYLVLFLIINTFYCFGNDSLDLFLKDRWGLNSNQKQYLLNGEIIADSIVETKDKNQSFDMKAISFHPKNCTKALRKLQLLESYQDWIDFIKISKYDENKELFTIFADHMLLPYPMIVHINVKRPTKPGIYNFSFPTGIFTGLKGTFEITEINHKCLVFAKSHWDGESTDIPDVVIELFSEGLAKIGGEVLIRKSR